MSSSVSLLTALFLSSAALAAPIPKLLESGWYWPENPDNDCKIRRENGSLIIEMPGTDHDYDPMRKRFNAPRLLRDIEGEFEIQVRVQIECQPSSKATVKGRPALVSAGFLLIFPEKDRAVCDRVEYSISQHGSVLERYTVTPMLAEPRQKNVDAREVGEESYFVIKNYYCKERNSNNVWDRGLLEQYQMLCDRGWTNWPLPKNANYAYLRLKQRAGGGYYFYMSSDGENWTAPGAHLGPPSKLKLGLAAYSSSSEPSTVRFDQLKIDRVRKKK